MPQLSISRLLHPRAVTRSPSDEAVKKALLGVTQPPLAAAAVPPSPKELAVRAARAQAIRWELFANNGRYSSRAENVAIKTGEHGKAHPLVWAVVRVGSDRDARIFHTKDDPEGRRLQKELFRDVVLPGETAPTKVALIPVHWEERVTLQQKFPDAVFIEDGRVVRGSSPRSLFVDAGEGGAPIVVDDIEQYSLKMHLSAPTYQRLGGLNGNRDINANDALMASVLSHAFTQATADLPLIEVQSEGVSIVGRIGGEQGIDVGAIFRKLPDDPALPGFAFFSPTAERLPYVDEVGPSSMRARASDAGAKRYLGADAIRYAMSKDPTLRKDDALLKLFVDPLLDVIFDLADRGFSMELHPQNFMLRMNADTGLTERVVIRDLHGLGYSASWRADRGLPDIMSVDALQSAFPAIRQEDLDGWFLRDGVLRDRYKAPKMFENTIDFFTTIFWYQLLDAVQKDGMFDKGQVTQLVQRIRDRVDQKAAQHGFDLGVFTPPTQGAGEYWQADKHGVRRRIVFRNPP